jgi:SAM-dependent methyltransferase
MLEIAKTKVSAANVNWTIVDMQAIPYENNHFDLVVCQFGLMLVPDRAKALAEIFRVLKKGGKLFFSTWAAMDENKLWSIANDTLKMHSSKQPLQADPGPFSMSDEKLVIDLLKTTGFTGYTASAVANTAEITSASAAAHGFIQGLPVYYFIQQQAPQLLHEIIASMSKKLVAELGDRPLKTPQLAWVFAAEK